MQQVSKLKEWLELLIVNQEITIQGSWSLEPLQGDASCRRYFRLLNAQSNMIVVVSPIARIDNDIFISRARQWRSAGVYVPQIFAVDSAQGFMLIEDFGSVHLFDLLHKSADNGLYLQAISELIKIQQIVSDKLPLFDREFLLREMTLFDTWLVQYQLQQTSPNCLNQVYRVLIENSLQQPQVTMHRDYHSRNLLLVAGDLAVIDFQDAVQGPLAYDLASLLRDCYWQLSDQQIDDLIDAYLQQLESAAVTPLHIEKQQFVRWFDLIGMQRHLKVLGLFIRLGVEEGKSSYLHDLPRVFAYVLKIAGRYPEFSEFYQWLRSDIQPALQLQPWYLK